MKKVNTVIGLISTINENSSQYLNEELKGHNVNDIINSHGTIFSLLFANDGRMAISKIVTKTGKRKSTITDMVKKLEKLDYIYKEKNDKDARITEIVLTKKGWDFQDTFNEISKNLISKAYDGFTDEEKETLVTLLVKLRRNFI